MPFKKLLDGKWILGNKDAIDCCMFRVETGNNLSIFTLDSMFGHRRLMWLFYFRRGFYDSGCNNIPLFLYLFCSDKLLQRALMTTRKT